MYNKATLIGNVGADPDIITTNNGKIIAKLVIATSEKWTDKNTGEKQEMTEWHRVTVFSEGLAKVVRNYIQKGSKVLIEGKIVTEKYTDKDGVEKYSTKIIVDGFNGKILMLGSGQKQSPVEEQSTHETQQELSPIDDEIPF